MTGVAVVGAAETTELGKVPGMSQIQLHADAALNAFEDAGISANCWISATGQVGKRIRA